MGFLLESYDGANINESDGLYLTSCSMPLVNVCAIICLVTIKL